LGKDPCLQSKYPTPLPIMAAFVRRNQGETRATPQSGFPGPFWHCQRREPRTTTPGTLALARESSTKLIFTSRTRMPRRYGETKNARNPQLPLLGSFGAVLGRKTMTTAIRHNQHFLCLFRADRRRSATREARGKWGEEPSPTPLLGESVS
jgi:hypothetical protein